MKKVLLKLLSPLPVIAGSLSLGITLTSCEDKKLLPNDSYKNQLLNYVNAWRKDVNNDYVLTALSNFSLAKIGVSYSFYFEDVNDWTSPSHSIARLIHQISDVSGFCIEFSTGNTIQDFFKLFDNGGRLANDITPPNDERWYILFNFAQNVRNKLHNSNIRFDKSFAQEAVNTLLETLPSDLRYITCSQGGKFINNENLVSQLITRVNLLIPTAELTSASTVYTLLDESYSYVDETNDNWHETTRLFLLFLNSCTAVKNKIKAMSEISTMLSSGSSTNNIENQKLSKYSKYLDFVKSYNEILPNDKISSNTTFGEFAPSVSPTNGKLFNAVSSEEKWLNLYQGAHDLRLQISSTH